MSLVELLQETVFGLDECVQALSSSFPAPQRVKTGDHVNFRHAWQDDLLLSFLKAVKIASHNNACIVLLNAGFIQEVYALCRMIDEAGEDIQFMAAPLGESGPSDDQRRFIDEFFQEEFDKPDDPLASAQKRARVSRRSIHAAVSRIPAEGRNPSRTQALAQTLYKTFSGFIHGAYVHIMELFGGNPGRFHTRGMLGTPRMQECLHNHVNYVYRSLLAVEIVARRSNRADVTDRACELSIRLARETGCLNAEGIAIAERRRARGLATPS
jgi:hypothetical protein